MPHLGRDRVRLLAAWPVCVRAHCGAVRPAGQAITLQGSRRWVGRFAAVPGLLLVPLAHTGAVVHGDSAQGVVADGVHPGELPATGAVAQVLEQLEALRLAESSGAASGHGVQALALAAAPDVL